MQLISPQPLKMEIGDYSVWWCPSVCPSVSHAIFCPYLLLDFTTYRLYTYTIWKPVVWSCAPAIFRRIAPKIWRKLAKNRQKAVFFCPYLLLGFSLYRIDFYTIMEHMAFYCAPAFFRRIAPKIWRKLAKNQNPIFFQFFKMSPRGLIFIPYESPWSEVAHL